MTNLRCDVTNCANHADNCCCRPDIKVTGPCACGCEQTCCSDFMKQEGGAAKNAFACHSPNCSLDVRCDAENCAFNNSGCCVADDITIKPQSQCNHPDCKDKTECASFKMR